MYRFVGVTSNSLLGRRIAPFKGLLEVGSTSAGSQRLAKSWADVIFQFWNRRNEIVKVYPSCLRGIGFSSYDYREKTASEI